MMVESSADFISPDLPSDKRQLPAFMAPFHSDSYRNVLRMASRVAKFDSSVLLSGETGVGKEIVARYIHWMSPRADRQMLTINCGALPETLLESELFGHKAGSFTGAVRDRVGMFEQAARGTVFLDEIGDISKTIQIKLLRVLQEREILRIGENTPRKVDIRTIAATHQDLNSAAEQGVFREDLLYRLRVVEIDVPPLRERLDDIRPLTEYFIQRLSRQLRLPKLNLDQQCLERFQTYLWPGNVRELQNAIEHAAIISGDGNVKLKHLPPQITGAGKIPTRKLAGELRLLAEVEMDHIQEVLRFTSGNRARAARILGISQTTLWRKLKNKGKYKSPDAYQD